MISDDDKSLFASELGDVKKIDVEARGLTQENAKSLKLDADKTLQRELAVSDNKSAVEGLHGLAPLDIGPHDILEYKNSGVQHGVYKKLRMGRYEIESKLDLHRLTLDEALKATDAFIKQCRQHQLRTVVISHGKAVNKEKPATLKRHLAAWLIAMPEVMAYHSCQPQHGGTGSVYVMLKKSEKQKLENRERFSSARVDK